MKIRFPYVFAALLSAMLLVSGEAWSDKRIALVIGNGAYDHAPPLVNPPNDARLMARTLRGLGFEVIERIDADRETMLLALRDFGDKLELAADEGVGLFYYAGHGVQVRGVNFMIPVKADIDRESDVAIFSISANSVLGTMAYAKNRLNFVVMDACRDNPFKRGFRSASRGLARMDAPRGTLIAYATAPGDTAADGDDGNSPYTKALVRAMREPGIGVEKVFKKTRINVMVATNDQQVPWESSSLTGDFYFKDGPALDAVSESDSGVPGASAEDAFWISIKDSYDPSDFEAYISRYPNGEYKSLALIMLKRMIQKNIADDAYTEPDKDALYETAALAPPPPKEDALWGSIKDSSDPSDFEAYLNLHPGGKFSSSAVVRLKEILRRKVAPRDANGGKASGLKQQQVAFAAPIPAPAPGPAPAAPAPAPPPKEDALWGSIKDSLDPADFEDFLNRHPGGKFSAAALVRLKEILRRKVAPRDVKGGQGSGAKQQLAAIAAPTPAPGPGPAPGAAFSDCPACPRMVVVPSGSFRMGSPPNEAGRDDDEGPARRVMIKKPFAMARNELTRREFAAFEKETGHNTGKKCWTDTGGGEWKAVRGRTWRDPGFRQSDDDPVVCVSWEDAKAYVKWLSAKTGHNYRLPSEAEWEYAARANTSTARFWGGGAGAMCGYANVADLAAGEKFSDWDVTDCRDGHAYTSPVGSYKANGFGLHDTIGNVWEWVEDCMHENYGGGPVDAKAWTEGGDCDLRILRGGSWYNMAKFLRAAERHGETPDLRNFLLGFRVARDM